MFMLTLLFFFSSLYVQCHAFLKIKTNCAISCGKPSNRLFIVKVDNDYKEGDLERREVFLLLQRIETVQRELKLGPSEPARISLESYLNALIDVHGSPNTIAELHKKKSWVGTWKLAYSTDPQNTILGNQFFGGKYIRVELEINSVGKLEQKLIVDNKVKC